MELVIKFLGIDVNLEGEKKRLGKSFNPTLHAALILSNQQKPNFQKA
jgi:hypothetical protein